MDGDWLPPQAPGSTPPPPVPPGAPPPPAPFELSHDEPGQADTRPAAEAQPEDRPNNDAVVAISCAVSSAGILFWTNGLSSVVSLALGIVAVTYARKAKRNVAEGRTAKHGDLANGAEIAGWISIGLSVIATIVWILVIVLT